MPHSWIGKTINNRYQIEKLLGQGGMSAVYQGIDPNLRRPVAIKLIHAHLSTNPNFIQRFKEEAAAVARLRHPNIVQVHDFNADEDTYYMVMEYLIGETLQARLRHLNQTDRQMPYPDVIRICSELCDAIGYAHDRGLIHRDIKPANIMLNLHNQAILLDFGIVKIVGGEYHTVTGATVGTVMYMSPEQMRSERVDERSDIYSLGVTLFEMISGQPPYQGDSTPSLMMRVLNDPLPDLSKIRVDLPAELLQIVLKAMSKEPQQRYQSMGEMAADLQKVQAELGEQRPAATIVDAVDPLEPSSSGTPLDQQATLKDIHPPAQEAGVPETGTPKTEPPPEGLQPAEADIAALPTMLDPPEEPAPEGPQAEKSSGAAKGRSFPTRKALLGAGLLLILAAVIVGSVLVFNARKPPDLVLSPVPIPAEPVNVENAENIVNLGKWETDSNISDLAISPDGALVGTSNNRNLPFYARYRFYSGLWQIETGDPPRYLSGHTQWVSSIAFSPDGQLVATGGSDDKVALWQVSSGMLKREIIAQAGGVSSLRFSNNNKLLVVGTWDGLVQLWQLDNGNLLRSLQADDQTIHDVDISPDDQLIASASYNHNIILWQVSDGSQVQVLEGHTGPVFSVDFSADGTTLASASEDRTIKIWRVSDGLLLRTIKGHSDTVHDTAFSPDGHLLASGSEDYTLRLWRVVDGQLLSLLDKDNDSINRVAFSPDGRFLVSGGANGWVQFWGLSEAIPLGNE